MSNRVDRIIEKAFLGGEFLTWLWWACQQSDGRFKLGEDFVEIQFDDFLVLESLLADSQENTFKGGEPSHSEEAHLGLQLGKKASKAKLRVRRGERDYQFILRASTLDLASPKLPGVMSKGEEEQFYERLFLLEELDRTINELFLGFMRKRLSPKWDKEILPSIRRWISGRSDAADGAEAGPPQEL